MIYKTKIRIVGFTEIEASDKVRIYFEYRSKKVNGFCTGMSVISAAEFCHLPLETDIPVNMAFHNGFINLRFPV